MDEVGAIFHQRANARAFVEALALAGLPASATRFVDLPTSSLRDALGPLGVPDLAIAEYERNVVPGDVLVTVACEAAAADQIANEAARQGGLTIRLGHAPTARQPGIR